MPFSWIWIAVFIIIGVIVYIGFVKYKKNITTAEQTGSDMRDQMPSLPNELAIIQSGVCGQLYERDIFYRFLQNRHFSGLIQALFDASIEKSDAECHRITAEIIRYQKHFKPSDILSELKKADQGSEFEKISTLLRPYVQAKN